MNNDSINVYAKLNTEMPEMTTFSICSWVKFTFEVNELKKKQLNNFSFIFFMNSRELITKFGHIVLMYHSAMVEVSTWFAVL
jgi:hypothetical protein